MNSKPAAGLITGGLIFQAIAFWFTLIYGAIFGFRTAGMNLAAGLTGQVMTNGQEVLGLAAVLFFAAWILGAVGFGMMLVGIWRFVSRTDP